MYRRSSPVPGGAAPAANGRRLCRFLLPVLMISAGPLVQAQPLVNPGGVLNAASYALPGTQNSAIAQGAMFVVFGIVRRHRPAF